MSVNIVSPQVVHVTRHAQQDSIYQIVSSVKIAMSQDTTVQLVPLNPQLRFLAPWALIQKQLVYRQNWSVRNVRKVDILIKWQCPIQTNAMYVLQTCIKTKRERVNVRGVPTKRLLWIRSLEVNTIALMIVLLIFQPVRPHNTLKTTFVPIVEKEIYATVQQYQHVLLVTIVQEMEQNHHVQQVSMVNHWGQLS